jgi:hypothetical protein
MERGRGFDRKHQEVSRSLLVLRGELLVARDDAKPGEPQILFNQLGRDLVLFLLLLPG